MDNRVIVVDDHPAVCMAIRLLLSSEGFDVVAETGDGARALELVEELSPSTMILDLAIANVDGLAVISEVVAKRLPVKIIVLTGISSAHIQASCRRLGAFGFVSKSQELSEVVYAVRAIRANRDYFPNLSPFSVHSMSARGAIAPTKLNGGTYGYSRSGV